MFGVRPCLECNNYDFGSRVGESEAKKNSSKNNANDQVQRIIIAALSNLYTGINVNEPYYNLKKLGSSWLKKDAGSSKIKDKNSYISRREKE